MRKRAYATGLRISPINQGERMGETLSYLTTDPAGAGQDDRPVDDSNNISHTLKKRS